MVEPRGPLLYYNISVKHPGLFQDFRKPVSGPLSCQPELTVVTVLISPAVRVLAISDWVLWEPRSQGLGPQRSVLSHFNWKSLIWLWPRLRRGHLCAAGCPRARHPPARGRHSALQEEKPKQRESASHQVSHLVTWYTSQNYGVYDGMYNFACCKWYYTYQSPQL